MKRPTLALGLAFLLVTGCPNPEAPSTDGENEVSGIKPGGTKKGPKATPVPTRKPGSSPTPKGQTATKTPTPAPTETPYPSPTPPNGSVVDPDAKGEARVGIRLDNTPGSWAIGPSLNRARVGAVAGSIADRIIMAEGEHRPSFEFLLTKGKGWILDDSYDGEMGSTAAGGTENQGVTFAGSGVMSGSELWRAGGIAGAMGPDGSSGIPTFRLYRDEGFSQARLPSQGGFSLQQARYAAATGIVGPEFIAAGGQFLPGVVVNKVELVNLTLPRDNQRTGLAMPVAVAGAASATSDKKLYVVGGYTFVGGKPVPSTLVQVYDRETNTWVRDGQAGAIQALPTATHSAAAAILNGVLYVAGGYGPDGKPTDALRACDLTGTRWSTISPVPTARAMLSLVAHDGKLFAMGGYGVSRTALQTVETYQP